MRKHNPIRGNPRVTYSPITREDIEHFRGDTCNGQTVRGLAFFVDGELSGIGGVQYSKDGILAFSEIKEGVTVSKATVWRCTKLVMEMIDKRKLPVCAISDPDHKTAPSFLERLGFLPVKDMGDSFFYERIAV